MAKMKWYDWTAFILLIIGGINWGLVALNTNLVTLLLGNSLATDIVYGAVGLAGLYGIFSLYKLAK